MGVFGAVFGCRGDGGFNGCCSGTRSGVVGFKVATLSRLVREKVPPARSKHPKIGVFTLAGRTFSRKCQWRGCAGRVFSRQSALRPGLVGDVAHEAGCRWEFCSIRSWLAACRRRVVPLMTPFPPFGDGPAEPSAASARSACGSRDNWTLGQRLLYSSAHADHCFASRCHEPARPGHGRPDAFPDPDVPA